MSAELERDEAFWKLVGALEQAGVLRHVMIIGTWAEWLYTDYFEQVAGVGDVRVVIGRTNDIDVYSRNYLMESDRADGDAGFAKLPKTRVAQGPVLRDEGPLQVGQVTQDLSLCHPTRLSGATSNVSPSASAFSSRTKSQRL